MAHHGSGCFSKIVMHLSGSHRMICVTAFDRAALILRETGCRSHLMFKNRSAVLLGWLMVVTASVVRGQTAPPASRSTVPGGSIKLTGADAKRAEELDKAIDAALKADRWDEAIAKAEELLAVRAKAQGPNHYET